MKYKLTKQTALVFVGLLGIGVLASGNAHAILISRAFDGGEEIDVNGNSVPTSGNDCAGYFGRSFGACEVFINDEGERIALSPVIAKIGFGGEATEINTGLYPSVTGDEFDVLGSGGGPATGADGSGTWTYTPEGDDPSVRFWVTKQSTSFNLQWVVADADAGLCSGDAYNLACLNAAIAQTSGAWASAAFEPAGISHLTFYDSEPPHMVPEPATLGLLGVGLAGLGLAARRRRKAA